ncbi:MAG TPA: hypothetical protein VJA83_06370 [Sulfuricurvum sp.]|nr:hypothetical protein [Sulfuricurvum sp.]
MKSLLLSLLTLLFLTGCSATWSGAKEDTTNAVDWTKGKVNQGAGFVKEKTE